MKHLSLVLFLLFSFSGCLLAQETTSSQPSTSTAYSPLQKGNWLVGAGLGSLNHTVNSGGFFASVYPCAGYFINNSLAIGTQVELNVYLSKGIGDNSTYGLSPFLRYYFPGGETVRNRWFAEARTGFRRENYKDENNARVISSVFGVSGGYAYFVSNSVALEGTLNLNRNNNYGSGNGSTNLSLGLAFQIYLPGPGNR